MRSRSSSVDSVDVVILNWNGREHLMTCLDALALQQAPGIGWRIVVVDNGSTDDSMEWLEERWLQPQAGGAGHFRDTARFGGIELVQSEDNLGFCGGNNLAVEGSRADAVVFLNNDTAPRPDWLTQLVGALRSAPEDVAAISGRLIDWTERRVDFVEGIMTFDGHAFQRGFGKPLASWSGPTSGSELLFACGGNMIVRRTSFLEAGGFDPTYFAYLEDVDLGWRLWSGGERVLFCGEAVARHRSMASSEQLGRDRRGFLFERNAFLTVFKNYDEEHFQRIMPAVFSTLMARALTLIAENNPGGELVRQDPYQGPFCANEDEAVGAAGSAAEVSAVAPTLWQKWRGWGTRELARRGLRKARSRVAARIAPPPERTANVGTDAARSTPSVTLEDPRAIAQLQAINYVLQNPEPASVQRQRVQERRRRSDREIFDRFPLAMVPTYPGDEKLFADPGFRALLPSDLPLVEWTLADLMELE